MEDEVYVIIGALLYIGFWAVIIGVIVKNVKNVKKAKAKQAEQAKARNSANPPVQQPAAGFREIINAFRGTPAQPAEPPVRRPVTAPLGEGDTAYNRTISGSLAYESLEGIDTCDEDLMHGQATLERTSESPEEAQPVFDLPSFDLESVRNGFIMGEVLNRPAWKR